MMKRSFAIAGLVSVTWLAAGSAAAGPIILASGGLQPMNRVSESFNPYWDGDSWDSIGSPCNVGSLAQGTACNWAGGSPTVLSHTTSQSLQFLGQADGSAVDAFYFDEGAASTYELTLSGEFTALNTNNEFGWYDPLTGDRHQLFSPETAAGDATTVELPATFGFYYANTDLDLLYFTDSSLNSGGYFTDLYGMMPGQQFAFMTDGDWSWLGLEDLFGLTSTPGCIPGACSDYDYNDMILSWRQTSKVPEPSTTALLGLGLLGFAWLMRRRIAIADESDEANESPRE